MDILMCPVCGQPLAGNDKESFCPKNHRFDRSRLGYLNLLRSQSSGGHHGDDRLMLMQRRAFLEKGYYHPMRLAVSELLKPLLPEAAVLLDCGCGEGYYSRFFYEELHRAGKQIRMICLDISKEAAKLTARCPFPHETVVGSAFELPVLPGVCDLVIDIFAPLAEQEFLRVLKPGGILLRVVPNERHLWQLKEAVYALPYENPPAERELTGFTLISSTSVSYAIDMDNTADILSLFQMTPYYYKTSREDQNKLHALSSLRTELDFEVILSRKNG